ncbi:MAG: hypothetical protein ICV59_09280 [Thermoleophilia bacterium]|nr:hypothetical protein [Thermoleophilia bacterium]
MARRLVALLAVAATALAGAHAAVAKEGANLMSFPTDGTKAGTAWQARFEAFSHEADNIAPAVLIRSTSGKTLRFAAKRAPGTAEGAAVYRADVVFPAAGVWTYGVQVRAGGPPQWYEESTVTIDPAATAPRPTGGGVELPPWLLPLAAALLLAGAGGYLARRALRAWVSAALR